MYDDILELSRLGLYPDSIREKAITLLVVQIGSRQAVRLVQHLVQWPLIEINIFLSEMTSVFDPFKLSSGSEKSGIVSAYQDSVGNWEGHSFEPFIDFLCQVMQSSEPTLENGIMDFLLQLYATNFRDPLATIEPTGLRRESVLHAACNYLLGIISHTESGPDLVCKHPLYVIWSRQPRMAFTNSVQNRERRRMEMWQLVNKECIPWRIYSTFAMVLDWTRPSGELFLIDVAFDLLEFSGSNAIEPKISFRALRSLHMFLTRGSVQAQRSILSYLDLNDHEHCTNVMKQIVVRLSTLITGGTPETKMFFLRWDEDDFKNTAVLHFIHCFSNIAKGEARFLRFMLEANILGLLRPFLEIEGAPGIANHSVETWMVYEPTELTIVDLIRDRGLETYLPALVGEPPDYTVYRRSVLIQAFDIFLQREDHHPFPENLNSPWDALPNATEEWTYDSFWTS
ncbi:hypothetical protein BDZ94DRAFT_1270499 [Collybia nuda]|uniref:Uncharacterized protein n=1 Tax=Collybia nuda TaxID=64659 RepID=A0A9P5XX78_9AGAR|nr:hypothetical protein BDZ94DRAFT_1270499 [Collybia nuda]